MRAGHAQRPGLITREPRSPKEAGVSHSADGGFRRSIPLLAAHCPAGKLAGFFFGVRLPCCGIGKHGRSFRNDLPRIAYCLWHSVLEPSRARPSGELQRAPQPRQLSALAGGASPFACQYLARSGTLAQDDGGVARLGASIFLP